MTNNPNRKDWWYSGKQLTEDQVLEAMSKTTSNTKAAEYLQVSLTTYKKYASMYRDGQTGKSLYDIHANAAMKNVIGRTWVGGKIRVNWDNTLREGQLASHNRLEKLKHGLIESKKLDQKCYRCGFDEQRVEDQKIPLIMNFKSGDKTDWRIQNIEMVCYNCAFLHCLDFFDDSVIYRVQNLPVSSHINKKDRKEFYQLDDFYLDHINKLGLEVSELTSSLAQSTDPTDDGSEFIDFV
jgi:hypothetical protein